jgi:hypothetical protein
MTRDTDKISLLEKMEHNAQIREKVEQLYSLEEKAVAAGDFERAAGIMEAVGELQKGYI